MMTTKNKFCHISNLAELDAAQKQLKRRLRRKRSEVEDRIYGLRDDYAAPRLFGMTMRTAHAAVPALKAVRFLKKKIASL